MMKKLNGISKAVASSADKIDEIAELLENREAADEAEVEAEFEADTDDDWEDEE